MAPASGVGNAEKRIRGINIHRTTRPALAVWRHRCLRSHLRLLFSPAFVCPVGLSPGGQDVGVAPKTIQQMVDAEGIPLGAMAAPANRHDSPLLAPTLDALPTLGGLPEQVNVHLDRAYDSNVTRRLLQERGLEGMISQKGKPAPLGATNRWVVERTNSWQNAHKKLVWCTERQGRVIDFWIAFSNTIIIVGRLIREAWRNYRWEGRPDRRP